MFKKLKDILQLKNFIFKTCNQIIVKEFSTANGNNDFAPTDTENILTMRKVREQIYQNLGLSLDYDPSPKPRDYLLEYEPKFEDLPPRTMQDSFGSAIIPLSKATKLRLKYLSKMGFYVRNGRLLEDIDLFACWICHKHLLIPNLDPQIPLPYTFVTILVDGGEFTKYSPDYNRDIMLSGHVSWTGRSSMEITIWTEQIDDNNICHRISNSYFLMGARNAINTKSAPVNPLETTNDSEINIFNNGKTRAENRINSSKTLPFYIKPNDSEQGLIHEIFMNTINKNSLLLSEHNLPKSSHWMQNTKVVQTTPCYPENLNVQNSIFGGYLIRIAIETSLICAYKFCGKYPHLSNICEILFRKPIFLTSFIEMTSHIIYTENTKMQILITADIYHIDTTSDNYNTKTETTNIFHFTFDTGDDQIVQKVTPRTYQEAMWYLEGRRKLHQVLQQNDDK